MSLGDMCGFDQVIRNLKNGGSASRRGWNGKDQYIVLAWMHRCEINGALLVDPQHDNLGSRFIMFVGSSGYQCGWLASQADLLADDWVLF